MHILIHAPKLQVYHCTEVKILIYRPITNQDRDRLQGPNLQKILRFILRLS